MDHLFEIFEILVEIITLGRSIPQVQENIPKGKSIVKAPDRHTLTVPMGINQFESTPAVKAGRLAGNQFEP